MEQTTITMENPKPEDIRRLGQWFLDNAKRDESGQIIPGQGIQLITSDETYLRLKSEGLVH